MATGRATKSPTRLPDEAEEHIARITSADREEEQRAKELGLTGRISKDVADTIFGRVIEWTEELLEIMETKLNQKQSRAVINKLNEFMKKYPNASQEEKYVVLTGLEAQDKTLVRTIINNFLNFLAESLVKSPIRAFRMITCFAHSFVELNLGKAGLTAITAFFFSVIGSAVASAMPAACEKVSKYFSTAGGRRQRKTRKHRTAARKARRTRHRR
jgi:hypothetical protein